MASQDIPYRLLVDDVMLHLAKNFIHRPRDMASLSCTCRRYYDLFNPLVYQREVELVKFALLNIRELGLPAESINQVYHNSALIQACRSGNVALAKKVLKAALSWCPDYIDNYSLRIVVRMGNMDLTRELLQAGSCPDPYMSTPILKHRTYRRPAFCNREISSNTLIPIMKDASLKPSFVQPESYNGTPPPSNALGYSICNGLPDSISEILALHTNELWGPTVPTLDTLQRHRCSTLHLASLAGATRVVRILLSRGYGKHVRAREFRYAGPLHLAAAREDNQQIIQLLLDHGEDPHMEDGRGRTALIWAVKHKCPRNALFLLQHESPYNSGTQLWQALSGCRTDEAVGLLRYIMANCWG